MKIELDSQSFGFKENENTTIEITINDIQKAPGIDSDIFTAFSVNDKYLANFNDVNGDAQINAILGQFIYPACSTNLARNGNLENVFSNINSGVNTWSGFNHDYSRDLTTSGQLTDWYRVSDKTTTDKSSFTYTLTNDDINDKSYLEFTSGNVNYKCDYNEAFDFDSDIYFYFQNDCRVASANEKSWIPSINITLNPILPTTRPTQSPTGTI